ncbi:MULTISPECIES: hypothetical protein [Sporosarcina]|uniref:Uncharacterized protein n=1 Tax=Sporosarcina contaminans TaxID=633403 RepID=A0ABW3U1C5_9BACL
MDEQFWNRSNKPYTLGDLFKGKDLEIVTATLLLFGKLKVDYVSLFREEPVIAVTLLGTFKKNKTENEMENFLRENGALTLEEVFNGILQQVDID